MTCFWKGLLNELDLAKMKNIFNVSQKPRPIEFIKLLQETAIRTPNVQWNGNKLSNKELDENLERIHSINANQANIGYDCSCSEPYLFLCCQLFKVSIDHNYNGHLIKYRYKDEIGEANEILIFGSDLRHFWASGKKYR